VHHDALELPDGQVVLVTRLRGGSTRQCCRCQQTGTQPPQNPGETVNWSS
jgi:hypothetical protein